MSVAVKPLEFGHRKPGQNYKPRPGSYAVAFNEANQVAIAETPLGCFLPGGGANAGESPEATLAREVTEECGCEAKIIRPLGLATEYVFADGEGYFAKECSFFLASLGEPIHWPVDSDHRLMWLAAPVAKARLVHGSQAWAVSQAIGTIGTPNDR